MNVPRRGPGLIPTIAAAIALALTLSAAKWQFDRAAYKASLQADYMARQAAPPWRLQDGMGDVDALRFRRVEASGEFLPEHGIYLDNRVREGVAGYEVIMPLRLAGSGQAVLVNRGWVARGARRADVPAVQTPPGDVVLTGTVVVPREEVFELSATTIEGRIWQNLVLSRYRASTGLDVADFVIQQDGDGGDGLLRRWTQPNYGIDTHRTYAVQWLIFASLIVFFYVYYGFIRARPETGGGPQE
jgi:surfeit locus 1 family protein